MKTKDIYMYGLGAVIVVAILAIVALLVFYPVPPENREAFLIVLGTITGSFVSVVSYFYGSSKGSSDKTELIGKTNGTPPPTP